jgi:hypothetical protein
LWDGLSTGRTPSTCGCPRSGGSSHWASPRLLVQQTLHQTRSWWPPTTLCWWSEVGALPYHVNDVDVQTDLRCYLASQCWRRAGHALGRAAALGHRVLAASHWAHCCSQLLALDHMQPQQLRARIVAPASLLHRSNQSALGTIRCNCFYFERARAFDDCFFLPAILLACASVLIVITCATHADPRFCGRQRQLDCSHVV